METVFLSWSGDESNFYATAWRRWINEVFSDAKVFLSSKDIRAGDDWRRKISKKIRKSKVGIVFVTTTNKKAPWMLFEAGALAIASRRRLLICVISGAMNKLPDPLRAVHAVKADKKGAKEIFKELKARVGEPEAEFSLAWPKLEKLLQRK